MYVPALHDVSSAFDTIDHSVLVHRLHTDFVFTHTVFQWFSSYLTDRSQYVYIIIVLPLLLYIQVFLIVQYLTLCVYSIYIKPLSAIIDSHSITHHLFADDMQVQMSAPPDKISELPHSMQSCNSLGNCDNA